jgi:hypothetical protein
MGRTLPSATQVIIQEEAPNVWASRSTPLVGCRNEGFGGTTLSCLWLGCGCCGFR